MTHRGEMKTVGLVSFLILTSKPAQNLKGRNCTFGPFSFKTT